MTKSLRVAVPSIALLLLAKSAAAAPLFAEQWETGTASWTILQGGPITTETNANVASHTYQHETVGVGGGRIQVTAATAVTPSTAYCLSAWVRGSAGTCPFIGANTNVGQRWLIGQLNYDDSYGGKVTAVNADGAWHWYTKTFTTTAAETSLRIIDELWSGCAAGTADFDSIEIVAGACPAAPRLDYGDTVTCANPIPVATATTNACVACTVDNGIVATTACPSGANPYCAVDGACGKCAAAADCTTRTGKFCSPSTGACVAACEVDGQCAANEFCRSPGGGNVCTAKVANGQPVPGGTCTVDLGTRACTSGTCDTVTNTCGATTGGLCASSAQCTTGVCVPSVSDGGTAGSCNQCAVNGDCPGSTCNIATHQCVVVPDAGPDASTSTDGGGSSSSDGGGSSSGDGGGTGGGTGGGGTGGGAGEPGPTDDGGTTDPGATGDSGDSGSGDSGGGCGCHSAGNDSALGSGAAVLIGLLVASRRKRRDPR